MSKGPFYSKELEDVLLRADQIFSREAPKALWLAILDTALGSEVLDFLKLDYSKVLELADPLDEGMGEFEQILTSAGRCTILTEPGPDCVEQTIYSILINRETDFSRMLDSLDIDRRRVTDLIVERLRQDYTLSYYDLTGVHPFNEGAILKACLQGKSVAREVLENVGVDVELVLWLCDEWKRETVLGHYLAVGVVKPGHLALALHRSRVVRGLMSEAGIISTRLRYAVGRAFREYPQVALDHELAPEEAGKEEAARLGFSQVTPDLLLLGLLSEHYRATSSALREAGFDIDELRSRLTPESLGEALDDPQLSDLSIELVAQARSEGGEVPDGIFLLAELIPHCSVLRPRQEQLRKAVERVRQGSLSRSGSISVDGLTLYMKASELEERLGRVTKTNNEHGIETWGLGSISACIEDGVVVVLMGQSVTLDGEVVLQSGDSSEKVLELFGVSGEVELFEPRRSTLSALVGERGVQMVIWGDLESMERTAA